MVFLFEDFEEYDRAAWDKVMAKDGVPGILKSAHERLTSVETWSATAIEAVLREMLEEMGLARPRASNRFGWRSPGPRSALPSSNRWPPWARRRRWSVWSERSESLPVRGSSVPPVNLSSSARSRRPVA